MLAMPAKWHWRTLRLAENKITNQGYGAFQRRNLCVPSDVGPGRAEVDDGAALVASTSDMVDLMPNRSENMMHFIWTIIIGFVAGLIARGVTPGDKGPQGFILTAVLGIIGALAATYLGQAIGWYGPDQNAGFIGAIVGAVLILLVWGFIDRRRRPA